MLENLHQIDAQLTHSINDLSGIHLVDETMMVISSAWLWVCVGIVLAIFLYLRRNREVLSIFIASLVALGASDYISFEVIKQIFRRERPCWVEQGIHWVQGNCGGSYGFTSNHAANAAAIVATLWICRREFSRSVLIFATIAAALVGFSRVYLGVHYVGDVLGGFVLGALIAAILQKTPLPRWSRMVIDKICR